MSAEHVRLAIILLGLAVMVLGLFILWAMMALSSHISREEEQQYMERRKWDR